MNRAKRAPTTFLVFLLTFLAFGTMCSGDRKAENERQVQNFRALAKLYGYLRYFNPSDEAAQIDWDALAIHAAAKVKDATDADELKSVLEDIFRPVAPSMALYVRGKKAPDVARPSVSRNASSRLVSWQHMGVGTGLDSYLYRSIRLNRPYNRAILSRYGLDATKHAGKTIKMSAWAKVHTDDLNSRVRLWLRVIRPAGIGFFDYMHDRPIRNPEWAEYTITGPIAVDDQEIAFGALVDGEGEFFLDGFRFTVTDASGREEQLVIPNGGFEEGDTSAALRSWDIESPSLEFRVQEDDFHEGKRALTFSSKMQRIAAPLFEKRAPAGAMVDREINRDLFVRFPLTLETDERGTIPRSNAEDLNRLRVALDDAARTPMSGRNEKVRLAGVIIAWNIFQHFYPYFDVVKVDWDWILTRSLERALSDRTDEEFLRTLSWLVARLDDGHGRVRHVSQLKLGHPPFRVEWVENQVVVTASRDNSFRPGDIVLAVDGRSAEDICKEDEEFISGSPQWRRFRSTFQFGVGSAGTRSVAKLLRSREILEVLFERAAQAPVSAPPAHSPIDKLEDGVFYVDLSRAPWQDIKIQIKELAAARGVVFDLRGYPVDDEILRHLLREPDKSSSWMKTPFIVLPDREDWTYQEEGFNLPTASPRIEGRVVFMTDARAISWAESVMGLVEHYRLGEIVGEPTAGANGDVNPFILPGEYRVSWTGMKVVKHDGSQHHTIGILPTIPCHRTIAGVAAGRDEFLEKALEVINRDLP